MPGYHLRWPANCVHVCGMQQITYMQLGSLLPETQLSEQFCVARRIAIRHATHTQQRQRRRSAPIDYRQGSDEGTPRS